MKSYLKLFCLVTFIGITACEKDSDSQNDSEEFQIKINGKKFNAQKSYANYNESIFLAYIGNIGTYVGLKIYNPIEGDYNLANQTIASILYVPDTDAYLSVPIEEGAYFVSNTGILNVASINKSERTVSGTFSGTLVNDVNESVDIAGSFDIPYRIEDCSAMIDGEEFVAYTYENMYLQGKNSFMFYDRRNYGKVGFYRSIRILLPENISVGEFPVIYGGLSGPYKINYGIGKGPSEYPDSYRSIANSGQIIITSVNDSIIKGTFSCDAEPATGGAPIIPIQGRFVINLDTVLANNHMRFGKLPIKNQH